MYCSFHNGTACRGPLVLVTVCNGYDGAGGSDGGDCIVVFITVHLLPGISSWLISTLPVHSPAFFPKPLPISSVLAVANIWFLCRPVE